MVMVRLWGSETGKELKKTHNILEDGGFKGRREQVTVVGIRSSVWIFNIYDHCEQKWCSSPLCTANIPAQSSTIWIGDMVCRKKEMIEAG